MALRPEFNIVDECTGAKNIIVTGHIKPDGDCIGSTIALTLYLRKRLPDANIRLLIEKPSLCFDSVKGIDIPEQEYAGPEENTDVCILLDTNAGRLGFAEKYFERAKKKINIDHHISNAEGCGDLNYIDPHASSASELVYHLIDESELDEDIARFLYLGIAHDTGVFRYSNTSPETMSIAGKLIGFGFDFSDLLEKTFYEKSYEQAVLIADIVRNSQSFCDGRVVYGSIGYSEYCEKKLKPADFDGAINELRIIKGCECAIFMYPLNEATYKVSLRSIGTVDVSLISGTFGGGGHKRAAGFFLKGTREETLSRILTEIRKQTGWTE